MGNLYTEIEGLCVKNGVNITTMCKDSGASRGSLTDLKMGRKQSLSADTLSKIASYFGVTVDYLLGNEQKEKPTNNGGLNPDDVALVKDQFVAFYGEVKKDLDESDLNDLMTIMRVKAEIKRKQKDDKG